MLSESTPTRKYTAVQSLTEGEMRETDGEFSGDENEKAACCRRWRLIEGGLIGGGRRS